MKEIKSNVDIFYIVQLPVLLSIENQSFLGILNSDNFELLLTPLAVNTDELTVAHILKKSGIL